MPSSFSSATYSLERQLITHELNSGYSPLTELDDILDSVNDPDPSSGIDLSNTER